MKRILFFLILLVQIISLNQLVFAQTVIEEVVAIADARVHSGSVASYNYGNDGALQIASDTNGSATRKSYIKFDLSNYDERSIKSASIELCMIDNNNYNSIGIGFVADNAWVEGNKTGAAAEGNELCWTNAPSLTQVLGILPRASARYENIRYDVTQIVKENIMDSAQISFMLYPTVKITYPSAYSSREDADYTRRPKLIIEKYDYDRVLSNIQINHNSYIEKSPNLAAGMQLGAVCFDQLGCVLNHEPLAWSIVNPTDGISINPTTGALEIAPFVTESEVTVRVSSGEISTLHTFYIIDENEARHISFGDSLSEEKHFLYAENSTIHDNSYRRINKDGKIELDISVHPSAQNYVTIKLSGNDINNGMLFVTTDDNQMAGEYGTSAPELDRSANGKVFEQGFIYSTYIIPKNITDGKNKIRLKIYSTGQATPYNATPVAEQTEPSRGVYDLSSHTSEAFIPKNNAVINLPLGNIPTGSLSNQEHLKNAVNSGIAKMLTWQNYGTKFDNYVKLYPELAMFDGMLPFNGVGLTLKTKQEWKDTNYKRTFTSNLATMNTLYFFAEAYHASWSPYYGNYEIITRIIKALDFLCIAQGANGGFQSASGNWVGGPNRINANGSSLEGFGQNGLSKAFCRIYDDIAEGGLDVLIDDDDNPQTPQITRRAAYTNMFAAARNHMAETGAGHAPNQDAIDKYAMFYHNEAIGLLSPSSKWPQEMVMSYVKKAVGLDYNQHNSTYWISPKGIAMEPGGNGGGGYDPGYSVTTAEIVANLALLTGDIDVKNMADKMGEALSNYFYETIDGDGNRVFKNEATIGWRNNFTPARDEIYLFAPHYAADTQNPYYLKMIRKYVAHGRIYKLDLTTYNAHMVANISNSLDLLLCFDDIMAATTQDVPFAYEMENYIWCDEMAKAVVINNDGKQIFMALDWRNKTQSPDSVARIHYKAKNNDITANIVQKNEYGFSKLGVVFYDNYIVAMNSDPENTYYFYDDTLKGQGQDLVTGSWVDLSSSIEILPYTTRVIKYSGNKKVMLSPIETVENSIKFSIHNTNDLFLYGNLYIVYYDDGKLTGVYKKGCTIKNKETQNFEFEAMGNNPKVFFWDENLMPFD